MAKKNRETNPISDIPESYQRYIDVIYTISKTKHAGWVTNKEISENLSVNPASVSGMLDKLRKKDLINWELRKSIRLTEKGKAVAMQLVEVHSLLRTFFRKVLKIDDETLVDKISCEIEHHITSDVKDSLKEFLAKYKE